MEDQKYQRIMARIDDHLSAVKAQYRDRWVGIFLYGSQNYGLDDEHSDIDTKAIVLPSFSSFVSNAKPVSTTHVMENNEHVDIKDIRIMFDCIRKQNINFLEILFTRFCIINPVYADLFQPVLDSREEIARYNNYAGMNCIMGMAYEKQKAMEHKYPSTADKIAKYGYDPKQLHHILRLWWFMQSYVKGLAYADCLTVVPRMLLMDAKHGVFSLEEARDKVSTYINDMRQCKKHYMDNVPLSINHHADEILRTATVEILKRSIRMELEAR